MEGEFFFGAYCSTVKPVLSDHVWTLKKWSLNTGGLLIKAACIVWLSFGTSGSGRSRQVVTEYKWSQDRFHCSTNNLLLQYLSHCRHSLIETEFKNQELYS